MTGSLSIATCAIYAVLIIPVLYLLVRHARFGLAGWLLLSIFCVIRIVGGALEISNTGTAAGIISSVGLSPLLLATNGILHEARTYRIRTVGWKAPVIFEFFVHGLVAAGVVLTAIGSSKLQRLDEPIDNAEQMVKVGIALLTAAWGILVGLAGLSFAAPRAKYGAVVRAGTILVTSVCLALVFIGIRVLYTLIVLCTQKVSFTLDYGTLALRVVLSFLPEVIAVIIYICAGIMTQSAASKLANDELEDSSARSA
ncbi:uncharacterized protein ASPGLDRAFT_133369 [Aspergillus glaucus CBS 516.65]|uniref:DUF7702 domain-containing protein n=1 Tax=Aspergillus glaucus CBS 516.65 TaxID=1160497 RepID=A0A1L9VB76_ASPGL|nr:hypothetical protein ASPGLDRAFT_133369 [Aspergillus glaucus CBS 516.65]OJJ81186.1 hypothetical protein ASPGLDRAFT_133369 [Aspergillus glaucus CBS 516.65]